jgi:hypothetical protein
MSKLARDHRNSDVIKIQISDEDSDSMTFTARPPQHCHQTARHHGCTAPAFPLICGLSAAEPYA